MKRAASGFRLPASASAAVLLFLRASLAQSTAPPTPAPTAEQAEAGSGKPEARTPPLPQATPLRFRAAVDKETVTLGEPFTLSIEIVHAPADAYALPDPLPLAPLTLRGKPSVAREVVPEGARTVFTLQLADVSSLEPRVPDLPLTVQGPAGARTFTVPGQKLTLSSLVKAEGADNAEHAHHGPKPPVPVLVRSWLWAGLLGGLTLIAVLTVLAARFLRARKARVVEVPPVPFDAEALARLADLRRREPWKRGEGRAAIFELSETLRAYLGKRLSFAALDLTSEELLRELKVRKLLGLDLAGLTEELSWEDLVKFAKLEPTTPECLQAVQLAEDLIRNTRHVPMPAASGGDARPGAPPPGPREVRP